MKDTPWTKNDVFSSTGIGMLSRIVEYALIGATLVAAAAAIVLAMAPSMFGPQCDYNAWHIFKASALFSAVGLIYGGLFGFVQRKSLIAWKFFPDPTESEIAEYKACERQRINESIDTISRREIELRRRLIDLE